MMNAHYPPKVQAILAVWQSYVRVISDWRAAVKGVEPKVTGWGLIYELPALPDRPSESFAIDDIQTKTVPITEPHYHPKGEIEINNPVMNHGVCME
jgi:hypothetical protein